MLLGSRLEAFLRLDDLRVCDGLRTQLDLDLLQLLPLPREALQALLQDVLAEPSAPINGDGAEVLQSARPFLHPQRRKRSSPTRPRAETNPQQEMLMLKREKGCILRIARASRQGTHAPRR